MLLAYVLDCVWNLRLDSNEFVEMNHWMELVQLMVVVVVRLLENEEEIPLISKQSVVV